jgi:predicted amidophosphoribosyltransferase
MLIVYPNWRLRQQRFHLEGTRCPTCQKVYFPPRKVCQTCLKLVDSLLPERPERLSDRPESVPEFA